MNSRTPRIACLAIAVMFLIAGVSQAMGRISSCTMPCCQAEKSNPCHAPQERVLNMDCCSGMTSSFSLGPGCGPEKKEAVEFSTVSHSPTPPPQGEEVLFGQIPEGPSKDHFYMSAAIAPSGKAPLYLQNSILLI